MDFEVSSILLYSTRMRKKTSIFLNFLEVSGKSHSAEKCKKGDPLGFFEQPLCCKIGKNEGGTFGDIEKVCKKFVQKKILVKGETRTHVLLLVRPQKSLINLYAKWQ